MTWPTSRRLARRRLLQGAGAVALATVLPRASAEELPAIASLTALLAGRLPRWERLQLTLPALADNGQAVPLKLALAGPFSSTSTVQAIHLFSEKNPVSDMAVFEFPVPPSKVEIDTRVRLAGSQRVVAIAVMSDAALYAATADVVVTIAACLDGS